MLYFMLIRVMRKKLYYFYQTVKKAIKTMLIWNMVLFFVDISTSVFFLFQSTGYYLPFDHSGISQIFVRYGINLILIISLWIYAYYRTKYIQFELYVRALMFGCGVHSKFDKMSLLITRSYFYKEVDDTTTGDETVKITPISSVSQTMWIPEESFKEETTKLDKLSSSSTDPYLGLSE